MSKGLYDPAGFEAGGFANFIATITTATWVDDFTYSGTQPATLALKLDLALEREGQAIETDQHWSAGDLGRFKIIKDGKHLKPATAAVKGLNRDSNAGRFFSYLFNPQKCQGALTVAQYGNSSIDFLEGLRIRFEGVEFPNLKRPVPMPVAILTAKTAAEEADEATNGENGEPESDLDVQAVAVVTDLVAKGPLKIGQVAVAVFKALSVLPANQRQAVAQRAGSLEFLKAGAKDGLWTLKNGSISQTP